MKFNIIFFVLIIVQIQIIFGQEIDKNRLISNNWKNADRGVILNEMDDDEYNGIVEMVFENEQSKMKIYYIGNKYRGNGIFFIYRGVQKEIVLETAIRYGPAIFWHNSNIVEIIIPTGSPFTHSFFYDFKDNHLSSSYHFPIYYDIENKVILIWGNDDFELYDIKTDELLKVYYARRQYGLTHFYPTIMYYIEKMGTRIMLYFNDVLINDENTGIIIMEIIASHTSHNRSVTAKLLPQQL